jgi:hypothetical protein
MGWRGFAILAGAVVVWFGLTRWVLPRCGINTCCCPASPRSSVTEPSPPADDAAAEQGTAEHKEVKP